jgi:hypothetical protein
MVDAASWCVRIDEAAIGKQLPENARGLRSITTNLAAQVLDQTLVREPVGHVLLPLLF